MLERSSSAPSHPVPGVWIAGALLVWTFAWENARTVPGVADASLTSIIPLPSSLRLVEVGGVALLFILGVGQAREWKDSQRTGLVLLFCLLLLSVTSTIVSALSGLTSGGDALQTVYSFTVPFLVVAIIGLRPAGQDDAERILSMFVLLVGVSVAVAWWEMVHLNAFGDDVHGLMRDAHHFASATWIVVLWWVARLWKRAGNPFMNALGILAFAPAALYASNEKSNIAFLIVLGSAVAVAAWRRGWGYKVAIGGSTLLAVFLVHLLLGGQLKLPQSFGHIQIVIENLPSIGFFEGYRKVADVTGQFPRIWAVGAGPASYGSFKAIDAVALGEQIPPLAARYTAESYRLIFAANGLLGSYLEQSTDLSAFFVEFGPIALLLFGGILWSLVLRPARDASRESEARPVQRAIGQWVILATCFFVVMSAFTAFYGWATLQGSVWPTMCVAGLLQARIVREVSQEEVASDA